jgi:mRNA-degrading endonuclease RelE of RelBE toxin-antitoxin system
MNSRTTRRFRALLTSLPANVRKQARDAYSLFRENSSHPGLHFKKVHLDPPTYSARVGIGYRAIGVLDEDTIT